MTRDEELCVLWWAAMPDSERRAWLRRAGGKARMIDAWRTFRLEQQRKQIKPAMEENPARTYFDATMQ